MSPRRRGRDAKPRERDLRTAPRAWRGRAALRASYRREDAQTDGGVYVADRSPSGHTTGVVIGTSGPKGGAGRDPGVTFAYLVRRKLRPLTVAPVVILDGEGRATGEVIVVDPVTGQRSRVRA